VELDHRRSEPLVHINRYDPHRQSTGKAYFQVTARSCAQIVAGTDRRARDDLDLHCTPDTPERTVCSE
jgi:hypothetical protein